MLTPIKAQAVMEAATNLKPRISIDCNKGIIDYRFIIFSTNNNTVQRRKNSKVNSVNHSAVKNSANLSNSKRKTKFNTIEIFGRKNH